MLRKKARKILRQYQQGKRNFQGANLQGLSFQGEDLSGADFSFADIRSTNFEGTNLQNANFWGAKAGLQKPWEIVLILSMLALAKISTFFTLFISSIISPIFYSVNQDKIDNWIGLIIVIIFWMIIIRNGIKSFTFGYALIFTGIFAVVLFLSLIGAFAIALLLVLPLSLSSFLVFYTLIFISSLLKLPIFSVFTIVILLVLLLDFTFFTRNVAALLLVTIAVVLPSHSFTGGITLPFNIAQICLNIYIAYRVIKGDEKYSLIQSIALDFASIGGTCFRGANLTDSNFTKATLKNTDFTEANVARTSWKNTKLDYIRAGGTYLENTKIRKLVSMGGENQKFNSFNFQEINLQGINLMNANFIKANLKLANLKEANLFHAKLRETLLDQTDFTKANLSGAELIKAELIGTNFSGANLSRANFQEAKAIKANFEKSDLTGINLMNASFIEANLKLANLKEANLFRAKLRETLLDQTDFIKANLSGAELIKAELIGTNFSGANLSGANFQEAKAIKANFEESDLTGACIEDWHINYETNFKNVKCDYIFLKSAWSEEEKKIIFYERRPHQEDTYFAPGHFEKLIRQSQETVDLIFSNGIDWKAFLISYEQLKAELGGKIVPIQALEHKGDGTFLVKIEVPKGFDKGKIEKSIRKKYKKQLKLNEQQYRQDLNLKDREIEFYKRENTNLYELMKQKANQPIQINQNQGNSIMSGDQLNINKNHGLASNKGEIESSKIASIINENNQSVSGQNNTATQSNNTSFKQSQISPSSEQKDLAEVVAELKEIIQRLEQPNSTETTTGQMVLAAQTIEVVENNPTLKQRFIGVIKSTGTEAFKEALDHPVVNVLVAGVQGWLEP